MKIRYLILGVLIIGLIGLIYSLSIEPYTDKDLANKLYDSYINYSDKYLSELKNITDYDAEYQKLKTSRFKIMDISLGLMFLSMSLLLYVFKNRVYKFADFRNIETTTKRRLILQSIFIWLLIIIAFKVNMDFMYFRKDSLHDLDAYDRTLFFVSGILLLIWIPLIAYILIISIKGKFPTNIIVTQDYPRTSGVIVELITWMLILIIMIGIIGLIYTGFFLIIPLFIYYIHAFLSLRAGKIKGLNLSE